MYKQAPGYSEKATSLFVLDLGPPQDLPDALRGEAWLFVQLPLSMLQQELRSVESRAIFGDSFQLTTAGLDDLPADTLIPGMPLTQLSVLAQAQPTLHAAPMHTIAPRPCHTCGGCAGEHYRVACLAHRLSVSGVSGFLYTQAELL